MKTIVCVLDAVGKAGFEGGSIGRCLTTYLRVCRINCRGVHVVTERDLAKEIAKDAICKTKADTLLLIAHASKGGFVLPDRSFMPWSRLGTIIREYLSAIKTILLCGCETGTGVAAMEVMSAAPNVEVVYGPREVIEFSDAIFAFMALFHLIGKKGHSPGEAVEAIKLITGVRLEPWHRPLKP